MKLGYQPEIDDDGDVRFNFQLKPMYVVTSMEGDDHFISMCYPQLSMVKEGDEAMALAICNKMTRDMKFVKVCLDPSFSNVLAYAEFYYDTQDTLELNIKNGLECFSTLRTAYFHNQREMAE